MVATQRFHFVICFWLVAVQVFQQVQSFTPGRTNLPTTRAPLAIDFNEGEPIERVLILMDGTCPYHSGYMAARALDIPGVAVIHVLSDYLRGFLQLQGQEDEETLLLQCPATKEDAIAWKAMLDPSIRLVGVYCESDSGLEQAERLRQLLDVDCQDTPTILAARRDKHLMYEVAKSAGLTVPDTTMCHSIEQAVEFATHLFEVQGHEKVVVKPFRGVASESVYLCTNTKDVEEAWSAITSSSVFGQSGVHKNVLVQQFVQGTEYAIDVVSRNGEHKVMAVWRYRKKPANGASFCYFKTELVDASMDENVETVCCFAVDSLRALGVKWGISHNECIVTDQGVPTLVEVNHRQHNMDVCPLVMACIGYNTFDVALLAYFLDDDDWEMIPEVPVLRAYGCMVHLVNYARGKLVSINHLDVVEKLDSVLEWEVYDAFKAIGEHVEPTVDIRTDAGWVQLVSENRDSMDRDFATIERLMPTMFQAEL